MGLTVVLYVYPKNKNSIATNGPTILSNAGNCFLKDDTSVIHPTFELDMNNGGGPRGTDVVRANYLFCSDFRRYYWIRDKVFTSADNVEITCDVDVLGSYSPYILQSTAYINYASKKYNPLIPDKRLPFTIGNKHGSFRYKVTGLSASGTYVVYTASAGVTGLTGLSQGYMCSAGQLSAMSKQFFGEEFLTKLKDLLYSPLDALYACMWIGCDPALIRARARELKFGELSMGSYPTVKNTASSETHLTPTLPFQDPETGAYDWRNTTPYTEWFIWLPGVGYQQFPMDLCLDGESKNIDITVLTQVSSTNGEISYTLKCNGVIVMFCKGNIGINLPAGRTENGLGNVVGASASAVGGLALGAATMNPALLAGGAVSAVGAAVNAGIGLVQHSVGASGAIGGLSTPNNMRDYIELTYVSSLTVEDPYGQLKELIGCPVFKQATLNDYIGAKVFCSAINYKWTGDLVPTAEEYDMIQEAFTSQDGVILEKGI